jgi:1,4-dihydroxy-2-naphthoate octaprenyltransferase
MKQWRSWLQAARLRTLPLASAGVLTGTALAAYVGAFRLDLFIWALLTALLLQVLSNFANDLGDSQHGADSSHRRGPQRAVQSGAISRRAMWRAVILTGLAAFGSGIYLLYLAFFSGTNPNYRAFFTLLGIGLLAIIAAINYTMGKRPYGYLGLGDLSVWLFFGLIAVGGTYFLFTGRLHGVIWGAAAAIGFWSVGVLNLNNMRDMESDRLAGKYSLPVRMGYAAARRYHAFLIVGGMLGMLLSAVMLPESPQQFIFLLTYPLFIIHLKKVWNTPEPSHLDPFLKQLALSTFLCALLFTVGAFWG